MALLVVDGVSRSVLCDDCIEADDFAVRRETGRDEIDDLGLWQLWQSLWWDI